MGGKVSALDNAGVLRSLKRERLNRRSRPTRREAQSALFEWIECCYGPRRLNSTLGYLASKQLEQ
jgi:putative transposase